MSKADEIAAARAVLSEQRLRDAMRRAFNLGQTYWQQADSHSSVEHRRSDRTRMVFDALVEETVAALGVTVDLTVTEAEVDAALQRHYLIPTDIARADMRRTLEMFLQGRTRGVLVAQAPRLLTREEAENAYANVPWLNGGESSPDWMDRINAVQRKLLEVNGLAVPAGVKRGGDA